MLGLKYCYLADYCTADIHHIFTNNISGNIDKTSTDCPVKEYDSFFLLLGSFLKLFS